MPDVDTNDKLRIPAAHKRLIWTVLLATGGLVAATVAIPSYAHGERSRSDLFHQQAETSAVAAVETTTKKPHDHASHDHTAEEPATAPDASDDGHGHDHGDPATKNAVSRAVGDSTDPATKDPTTAAQASANTAAVEARRDSSEPTLVPGDAPAPRQASPEDRYAMAGGCYALSTGDRWVRRSGGGLVASGSSEGAEPFHFQATTLGQYLLYGTQSDFLAHQEAGPLGGPQGKVVMTDRPSDEADWTVEQRDGSFFFRLTGGPALAVDPAGNLTTAEQAAPFALHLTSGCESWPEVDTNVSGQPHRGATSFAEVRGYADAHTHGMAFEFLGGKVHCGKPWHPYGVEYALVDCEDHTATGGNGAALETFLSGKPSHDPVGWPTFKDWPAPDSLTHEGTYYKWMERSWRGGLRLFVNLLVENNQLCQLYPLKKNSCDDMDSIRLQAQRMREFEAYIDAQSGGPGEGWYRIVASPFEAREAINQGKLAVVMGIETSVVFGCTMKLDVPQCTKEEIDRQLDEVHRLGVRQMELVNKFDNALSGVAGDEGTTGVVVNSANFLETGSFWKMRTCPESYGEGVHDKEQYAVPREVSDRDPLFGAIAEQYGPDLPVASPVYGPAPHCNARGLTELGDFTIRGLVERNMLFDPDHMSVDARKASLDLVEKLRYPGVLSSHSWSTPDAYPRISELGGFIAPYAGDSTGFVDKWKYHVGRADPRYFFGLGFGADINGLGAQGDPRGADAPNPVTYPFTGLGGVTVDKQVSGERVYDINVDGVAHYGLYPDWVEDLRQLAGDAIAEDMAKGAEAYLLTWERALGIEADSCSGGSALKPVSAFRRLAVGTSAEQVLREVGQPTSRIDDTYQYCAAAPSGRRTDVRVVFDSAGRLAAVRT